MHRSSARLFGLFAMTLVWCATVEPSFGYGLLRYGTGRADYAANGYYAAPHGTWPGQSSNLTYNFGKVGADTSVLPTGVTANMVLTAYQFAANQWSQYANITVDTSSLGAANTGILRFDHDTNVNNGAYALPYNWNNSGNNFGTVFIGKNPGAGATWNQTNLNWIVAHEMGHMLGLRDMYQDFAGGAYAEDFVDHLVAGSANPQRDGADPFGDNSRRDNIMDRYRYTSNNYALQPQSVIDNDEIAGVTWLWGGPQNQIVTADFPTSYLGGRLVLDSEVAHGDQVANGGPGWWDYRVSFKAGGNTKPYVDLEFPGYNTFTHTIRGAGNPAVTHTDLGNDIHRFEVQQAGWSGNLELYVKSDFTTERRVRSWVSGGGQTDSFVLPIEQEGLARSGNNWAVVFGPQGPVDVQADFGDLPDSYGTTFDASGPYYTLGSARLGDDWDTEIDGQPTIFADGDQKNLWLDPGASDEDGVFLFGDGATVIAEPTAVGVNVMAHLDAWFDLNRDGVFDHATEHFIDQLLSFDTPTQFIYNNLGFQTGEYNSRFRLTVVDDPGSALGGITPNTDVTPLGEFASAALGPYGGASVGEVEDYFGIPEPTTALLLCIGAAALPRRRRG